MPKIVIDGRSIECREGVPVLQAALEAGWNIPHYCYHPGLSIVASCRLCLMEMKQPDPKTKEQVWSNKLFPSCQTPVRDGMEVRFSSPAVAENARHCMEYYLLNHPLDCPVCDKAGECYLQDYSEEFGDASSRMVDEKHKNPKKDIGPHTLLYQDRCVLCSRCVRFCSEVAGGGELTVVDRGSRAEIDVFPGVPLTNPLQGNVVDLCPVGALLDKDFLFKQRVWLLNSTPSVSPADSSGATIWIDHNEDGLHRIRPRFNERVNEWWISDEQRFEWRYVYDPNRWSHVRIRDGQAAQQSSTSSGADSASGSWEELPKLLRQRFQAAADAGQGVAAVLSPMMSCEEAWLLARFIRSISQKTLLALGPVPRVGQDQPFPKGFVIRAEKCPNRRGVERVLADAGNSADFDEFIRQAEAGRIGAAYVVGGYPMPWASESLARACSRVAFLVVHDLFDSPVSEHAGVRIPAATWAEREGCFMNRDGLVQAFERALKPREGVKMDGQFLFELAGESGLYRAQRVREQMAARMPEFAALFTPRPLPAHAH